MRGLVFLLLTACSNDQFTADDAGVDADGDTGAQEAGTTDVVEASSNEGGPAGFCATQTTAFYCDDFDTLTPATASFSVTTPASAPAGTFDFGPGKSGKGLAVKASGALSMAYVTKQVQSNVLHGFTFAIQLSSAVANVVYVRVQAQSSSFTLAADLGGGNLAIKGDSGNAQNVITPDGKWHVLDVQLASNVANVAVDGKTPVPVPFAAQGSASSTIDVGVITAATLGANVLFDEIALR